MLLSSSRVAGSRRSASRRMSRAIGAATADPPPPCSMTMEQAYRGASTGAKATFVLNNVFARDILKMSQIEAALGTRVAVELPYDPYIYLKAINEGVPVVLGAQRTGAAERLTRLAAVAFELDAAPPMPALPDKRGSLLGGLIRR